MDEILKQLNEADSFFGQYETKIMRLKNLLEITKIINSTLEEDKLAQTILFSCQGQFLVQNATLILLEDIDQGIYSDRLSIGLEKERFGISLRKDSCLASLFLRTSEEEPRLEKKAYLGKNIIDLIEDPIENSHIKQLSPEVISPLWGKSSLYGFLILGKKLDTQNFNSEDLNYIYQFAELAAISIENAKLFEMAIIDRMTRLYNHQYFKNRLYEEIERCKRYRNNLSLMFFDIDHFKSFNDTYGHQQGDIVLKEVAKIMKESVRKSDIPARYGGEEFAVILPETGIDDALIVGEKVRKRIERYPFPGQAEPLHVTISCGIAQYPLSEEDYTSTDFVEMADQALYYSKRNGRNQVTIYSKKIKKEIEKKEGK
jgi:diguanylate cyclase (GGDEF)-like protein